MQAERFNFSPALRWLSAGGPEAQRAGQLQAMELHWQRDIIVQWLQASPVPQDSRKLLEEMLASVDREIAKITL